MTKPTNYSASELSRLFDTLKADKSTMENHHQDVNDYVNPSFSDVTQINETPGRKKGQNLYTGIGSYCTNKLAKAIHGALTSTAAQWFEMGLANPEIMKEQEIASWFAQSSRVMFDYMVQSNFPNEIMKAYKSLIGYGTAAINTDVVIDPRTKAFDKLKYESWYVREFVFAEGSDELPTMVMRLHRLTPAKAMETWGSHPRFTALGQTAQAAYDKPERRYKEKHEYLEVFYKRDMYSEEKAKNKDWRNMPWGYCVVDYKDKKKIIQGGQMEQSTAVGRWEKNADDLGWGRSPAMEALPTIKTINEIRKNGLKSLDKDLNPPLVISYKGVIGNVRTHAGGIIYKRRNADIDTLDSGSRYDAAQLYTDELKQEVKEHFMVDMLEMQPNTSGTLGEFQIRYEQMMRLLGPTYGRLTYDIFNPLLYRTFNLLLRNNKFPEMPESLIQIAGDPNMQDFLRLDVSYSGPLARSQRGGEIEAIGQAFNDASMISQATGSLEAFDHLDVDKAMELSTELRGVPAEIRVAQEVIDKKRKERAEAAQAQAEAAERMQGAEVAGAEADVASKVVNIQRGQQ